MSNFENNTGPALLQVKDLSTNFFTRSGVVTAVNGVSFDVHAGETVGVVGESGCGKSVTALSILRLVADPPGRIVSGEILLDGRDLLSVSEQEMKKIRGNDISMIFQEPMTSLNPVITIGHQIAESLILHQGMTRKEALIRAIEMLELVRIPEAAKRIKEYPHQLSGGMRQRVMIAMAVSCNPKVLIADEPTTALDVTIQAQILDLILNLQKDLGTAVVLITHDLGVVAETAKRVVVMYAGRKVEESDVEGLFAKPMHPYTEGLLSSVPHLGVIASEDPSAATEPGDVRLTEIPGIVPALINLPPGCTFAPRCPYADEQCRNSYPPYEEKMAGHWSACWHSDRIGTATPELATHE
ncbi:MAG: peptide/nickel transport system ATP-binding protein [Gammaproteobacteria bacterium]|jgi:peptide/nickel transport system ATP-binding protein